MNNRDEKVLLVDNLDEGIVVTVSSAEACVSYYLTREEAQELAEQLFTKAVKPIKALHQDS